MRIHTGASERSIARAFPTTLGAVALVALVALAGCDLPPTSAPIIEQRWIVPGETSRITVASLLPSGVSILPDSSGFTLSAAQATVTRTLAQDCAECSATQGSTTKKPALLVNASLASSLAADISSATLTGGSLAVTLTNNYLFDPLRPNGNVAPYGSATITVSNGGTTIGTLVVDGATHALVANGGQLNLSVPLSGPVSGSTPVSVSVRMNSPEGTAVHMDANRTLSVNATPTNLKVANATVAVVGRTLTSTTDVDFSDIDGGISDRTQKGALLLSIENPFDVTSTLQVQLRPDGGDPINKTVALVAGSSERRIEFTKEELQQLFGHRVTISITGPAASASGSISVSPKQAVVVKTRFDLSLSVGG
ncbi:MAG: hypothetical protein ACO1Q7_11090 [Gemmatimonas sp.]